MNGNWILAIEVFFLIMAVLNLLKNSFNVLKVIRLKEGKITLETPELITLGVSISYIITVLILGF